MQCARINALTSVEACVFRAPAAIDGGGGGGGAGEPAATNYARHKPSITAAACSHVALIKIAGERSRARACN